MVGSWPSIGVKSALDSRSQTPRNTMRFRWETSAAGRESDSRSSNSRNFSISARLWAWCSACRWTNRARRVPPAKRARVEGELVRDKTGLPVAFFDERMTTARALGAVRDLGGSTEGRKAEVDQLAATVLLQTYLDGHR